MKRAVNTDYNPSQAEVLTPLSDLPSNTRHENVFVVFNKSAVYMLFTVSP